MGDVFKKTPEQHASQKSKHYTKDGIFKICIAVIKHISNHRQVHTPDHQRMRFGQHLEVIIFKQAGLSFIINFFEVHAAKIGKLGGEKSALSSWPADFNQLLRVG